MGGSDIHAKTCRATRENSLGARLVGPLATPHGTSAEDEKGRCFTPTAKALPGGLRHPECQVFFQSPFLHPAHVAGNDAVHSGIDGLHLGPRGDEFPRWGWGGGL